MLCAYVICHRFFRTLFTFISKIIFIVTIFYVPTCSQNFYKFKGLLNAIKMTIILICNCITKRTHHIAGLKKSQSIYYSPPFLLIFYLEVPGPVILIVRVIKRGRFNFAIGVGFVVHLFIIPSRVHLSPLSFYY